MSSDAPHLQQTHLHPDLRETTQHDIHLNLCTNLGPRRRGGRTVLRASWWFHSKDSQEGHTCSSKRLECQSRPWRMSPWAHLHVVGMLRFMSDIDQPSLPIPFYPVLTAISVFMALSTLLQSINSPDKSSLSHSVLPVLSLPCWSFRLYISLYESLLQPWYNPQWLTRLKTPIN